MPQPRCYADPNPSYTPAMRLIQDISQEAQATITTTFAHGYLNGLKVRLDVPYARGMQQINEQSSPIVVTGATTFTVSIDTRQYDPFVVIDLLDPLNPPPTVNVCAQVVPIGELNSKLDSAVKNVL